MKDAQLRMPESFLSSATELTPELQKVRLEGEKNAQDAARASSDRLRKAKTRANFTSRQKLTVDDREKMVELLNNCGGEVRWSKEVLYRATFVDIWQLKKVRGCVSWQKKFLLEERQMDQTRIPGPKWAHV